MNEFERIRRQMIWTFTVNGVHINKHLFEFAVDIGFDIFNHHDVDRAVELSISDDEFSVYQMYQAGWRAISGGSTTMNDLLRQSTNVERYLNDFPLKASDFRGCTVDYIGKIALKMNHLIFPPTVNQILRHCYDNSKLKNVNEHLAANWIIFRGCARPISHLPPRPKNGGVHENEVLAIMYIDMTIDELRSTRDYINWSFKYGAAVQGMTIESAKEFNISPEEAKLIDFDDTIDNLIAYDGWSRRVFTNHYVRQDHRRIELVNRWPEEHIWDLMVYFQGIGYIDTEWLIAICRRLRKTPATYLHRAKMFSPKSIAFRYSRLISKLTKKYTRAWQHISTLPGAVDYHLHAAMCFA